jgi:rod shape-determining protein MreC
VYQRRRARLLLVLLVLSALVLVTVDFRAGDEGPLHRLRGVATTVFQPIQDGLVTVVRPVGDAAGGIGDVFRTRSENARLRAQIEALQERRRSTTDLERENEELRGLLAMRDLGQLETIAARTVALGPSNFEWTITIDVGSADGVERDMPVINGDGLVGRIIQVTPNAARVLLTIDPNFGAAARVSRHGETGYIDGRGGEPMIFRPLDPEIDVEVGDELVTSTYQGGVFPGGIRIGTVSVVDDAESRLAREVQVQPFVDFTRLHHVLVVVNAPVDEIPPMTESPDVDFTRPDVEPTVDPDEVAEEQLADDEEEDGDEEGTEGDAGDGDDP